MVLGVLMLSVVIAIIASVNCEAADAVSEEIDLDSLWMTHLAFVNSQL